MVNLAEGTQVLNGEGGKGAGTGKEQKRIHFFILEGRCIEAPVWLLEVWPGACWNILILQIALIKALKADEPHPKLAH